MCHDRRPDDSMTGDVFVLLFGPYCRRRQSSTAIRVVTVAVEAVAAAVGAVAVVDVVDRGGSDCESA